MDGDEDVAQAALLAELASAASAPSLVTRVLERCGESEFRNDIDAFINTHCRRFADVSDAVVDGDATHDVWQHTLYQQFIALFERKVDEVAALEGTTTPQLCRYIREAQRDGGAVAAREAAAFVDLMLTATSYPAFLRMMVAEAREAADDRAERKLAEPDSDDDDGDRGEGKK